MGMARNPSNKKKTNKQKNKQKNHSNTGLPADCEKGCTEKGIISKKNLESQLVHGSSGKAFQEEIFKLRLKISAERGGLSRIGAEKEDGVHTKGTHPVKNLRWERGRCSKNRKTQ